MIYLKTFKLSDSRITNNNIYPFNVLQNKEPDIFIFDNITVLYGNNGSGKSTILNIIAHKLNLKGKERSNPKVVGTLDYFEDYASKCEYELEENENGRKLSRIPENSRYIKSEEILYEIRKIIATHSPFMLGILNAKIYNLDTVDYKVQKWSELENVRYFYNFFKSRKNEFEK